MNDGALRSNLFPDVTVYHTDDPSRRKTEEPSVEIVGSQTTLIQTDVRANQLKRQNTLPPVLQLPSEILAEIFMHMFRYNKIECWVAKTPMVLGEVCSTWRAVAWSIPQVWCTLSLEFFPDEGQDYSNTKIALLQEWLSRTKNLPLSMTITLGNKNYLPGINQAMDILARSADRWKNVRFDLDHWFKEDRCFVPTQFPLLESIISTS